MPLIMGRSSHAAAVKRSNADPEGQDKHPNRLGVPDRKAAEAKAEMLRLSVPHMRVSGSSPTGAPTGAPTGSSGRVGWGETDESVVQETIVTSDNAHVSEGSRQADDQDIQRNTEHDLQELDRKISDLSHQADEQAPRETNEQTLNKFIGAVIVINTLMMGIELDYGPDDDAALKDRIFPWLICESIVVIIFCTELAMRMNWERQDWIKSGWNWLDLFICTAAIVETWILTFVNANSGLQMLTLLRIVRLVRLIRVVRLVRMFRALYISVMAFKAALSSIFYICVLMVVGLFVCAIFTTSTIGHSQELCKLQMGINVTGADRFGSVPRSMYSLFELMTLEGWEQVGRPLVMKEPAMAIFLFAFIMVFTFGILNMIVAMVVEKTLMQARSVEETGQKEMMHQVAQELRSMKTVFQEMDDDASGVITRSELIQALQDNDKVQAAFKSLGIPVRDAETLFTILDSDCSGSLTLEELLEGLARVRGATDPDWDQLAIYATVRNLARQVQQLETEIREAVHQATTNLSAPNTGLSAGGGQTEALRATASASGAAPNGTSGTASGATGDAETLPGEVPVGDLRPAKAEPEADFQAEVFRRLDSMASAQVSAQRDVLRRLEALEEQLSKMPQ